MSYANRGMGFEALIDHSNAMYDRKGIAVINKRPTPVKVLGQNEKGMIHGFYEKSSTVDYDGVYRGRFLVFEAKSTQEKMRFDLSNIQQHQYDYLKKVHLHGGIAFILVYFEKHQLTYLMEFETLKHYWERAQKGGRKSIRIEDFDIHAHQVDAGRVPVDYLAIIDRFLKGEKTA